MKNMDITYKLNADITVEQFINLLNNSTLGERRPVSDRACMEGMIKNSNLVLSAWFESQLVGVARSVTDFHYACYLSDLAVDIDFQKQGIGKRITAINASTIRPSV